MTPFQKFRLWARRAPLPERVVGFLAAAVAAVVLAYVGVPASMAPASGAGLGGLSTAANASGTGAGGSAPIETGSGAPVHGGAAVQPGAAGANSTGSRIAAGGSSAAAQLQSGVSRQQAAAAGSAGGAAASAGACASPPGGAQGISRNQIKIAVMIPNINGAAANSTFGVPPPEKTRKWYQDVVDSLNASGGVACRKIVPTYFEVNPADQGDLQAKCLAVADAGVYATLDEGGYGPFPQKKCFAQHQIPFFTGYPVPAQDVQQSYPYLFSSATYETIYRNTVFALRDRGFFNPAKGFGKLGFVYNDCYSYLISDMTKWLNQAGVPNDKIVPYDMGCSSTTMPSPSDVQQAVLKFRQAGVTHVTTAEFVGGFWIFTRVAEQQGFRPKYGIPDDNVVAISYGSNSPDANNIAGAIAITPFRAGEETTPGYHPSAGTLACNAIHAKGGEPPVYEQAQGVGGTACNELWVFKAAVEHAPALNREALPVGLEAARSVELSFPYGPGDMSARGNTAWMNHWRVDQFVAACKCWRVLDPVFHSSYG